MTSPSLSLYKTVVLPEASRPSMRMRWLVLPEKASNSLVKIEPIVRESEEISREDRMRGSREKVE
jgi:hypothetical protein